MSDCSDRESGTSTAIYDHVPFSTIEASVLALAYLRVWPGARHGDVSIERLPGGGFNRIIGLNCKTDCGLTRYILRIPRHRAADLSGDVAALLFLRRNTNIPVPRIITFDETSDNLLRSPYMIQTRIEGTGVHSAFPSLNHSQRCRFAHELGKTCRQLSETQSSDAGFLVLPLDQRDVDATPCISPLTPTQSATPIPYDNTRAAPPAFGLLRSLLEAKKAAEPIHNNELTLKAELMDQFLVMLADLDSKGWLSDIPNSLAHLDFAPRNILINTHSSTDTPIITAVLDWDSAVFAPAFLACAPPLWLWAWQDDEEEDERTANDEPLTDEARQLKRLFEEAAGTRYTRFAYTPAYRLARRLVMFAIKGISFNEDVDEAEKMLEEWAAIKNAT